MVNIVECHSGYTYGERPVALTWQGQRLIIAAIISRGRTPQAKWFRVSTVDGQVFELSCLEDDAGSKEPVWQIRPL